MAGRGVTGPPPKLMYNEETLKQVKNLAGIQCTQEEAAAVLDVSLKTFKKYLNKYPEAREQWWIGKRGGTASLRRIQFNQAKHNPIMAKWLGIQYLGQSDKREQMIDVSDNRSTEQLISGIASLSEQIRLIESGGGSKEITIEPEQGEVEELHPLPETEVVPQAGE